MKFVVDCMLGKLAKWLKILGFDVVYFPKIEDEDLLGLARKENRVILTRDTGLLEKAGGMTSLFIESESWKDQVKQVLKAFRLLRETRPYSRCVECNVVLKNLPRKKAVNLVPPFVFEHSRSFALCPACGRVFWQGTHFEDMEFILGDILGEDKKRAKAE